MIEPIAAWWNQQHEYDVLQSLTGSSGKQEWQHLNVEHLVYSSKTVLNIGIGKGQSTRDLHDAGCIVDVLDISSLALNKVSDITRSRYIASNIKELPSSTYDLALSFLVAQHMSHNSLQEQLNNVVRSLRPSGVFAIQVPSPIEDIDFGDDSIDSQKLGTVVRSSKAFIEMVNKANGAIRQIIHIGVFNKYSFEWIVYHIRHA